MILNRFFSLDSFEIVLSILSITSSLVLQFDISISLRKYSLLLVFIKSRSTTPRDTFPNIIPLSPSSSKPLPSGHPEYA